MIDWLGLLVDMLCINICFWCLFVRLVGSGSKWFGMVSYGCRLWFVYYVLIFVMVFVCVEIFSGIVELVVSMVLCLVCRS